MIHARRIIPEGENQILVLVEDITAQKRAERVLVAEQRRLQRSVQVGATALHESEAALLRTHEELRALTAGLLNTQEEERRRVSRELHDDLSQKVAKLQFDVETLEQQLPPELMDGKRRLLKLIFLTMHADSDYVAEAFRAGAMGYLLKRAAASELKIAIREVLKGHHIM